MLLLQPGHLNVASMENDFILEPALNGYSQKCSLRASVSVSNYGFGVSQEQPKTGTLRPESPKQRSETKAVRDHKITNTSGVICRHWEQLLPRLHCRLQFEVVKTQCTLLYSCTNVSLMRMHCLLTHISIVVCQSIHYKWYRHKNEKSEGDTDTI